MELQEILVENGISPRQHQECFIAPLPGWESGYWCIFSENKGRLITALVTDDQQEIVSIQCPYKSINFVLKMLQIAAKEHHGTA